MLVTSIEPMKGPPQISMSSSKSNGIEKERVAKRFLAGLQMAKDERDPRAPSQLDFNAGCLEATAR